ncbi:MAG TPA: SDR family oxidoreductase [Dactylosporangium sp.]|jgi:NAD(P)-dependent dehydrogenase (short-subunit alcohol dehydrogenase family)|nr:SDR family oxidoreductase [Dactylosporangium sp.]
MELENAVVLVTGGNRGLGKAFVEEALARGARKVYAAARDPRSVDTPGATPLALDVTDPDSVRQAADAAPDVTLVVNNAGITTHSSMLDGDLDDIRREFETNFYGPVLVTRAFAPVLGRNGGGHLLNVHSVLSWISQGTSYSTNKAALWQATNGFRIELAPQGTGVTGLHVGYVDTDMAANVTGPKVAARDVARQAFDGVEAGAFEVLADDVSRNVKRGLSADPAALYPQLV